MIESRINDRWDIVLPEDRHEFHAARPTWEGERLTHMAERVQEGMTVFDIGAESGDFTSLYRGWVGHGEVVAFEPSLPYWPSIRLTWEANGHPDPLYTFAGFVSDVTDLSPPQAPGNPGFFEGWPPIYSVGDMAPDFGFRHLAQDTKRTPQVTLDDFVERTGLVPNVLMIDIEGAEHSALRGAVSVLREHKPLLYVSVHPPTLKAWYSKTPADIHRLLVGFGYHWEYLAPLGRDGEDYLFAEPG